MEVTMMTKVIVSSIVITGVLICFSWLIYFYCSNKPIYSKSNLFKRTVILLKKRKRKSKILYVFKDLEEKTEFIISLNKSYLSKKYIPNEFLIERSPKKVYYQHLNEMLKENETYIITFAATDKGNKFLLASQKKYHMNFMKQNKK